MEGLGVNHLVLSGQVVKPPKVATSPAGIKHLYFTVEHHSIQNEAGFNRQCKLRIQAIASGELAQNWSDKLTLDSLVQVTGFLQRYEEKSGLSKLVLHCQNIKRV